MNARFATILTVLLIAAAARASAQRSILTLMPRPKAAFERPGQFVFSNQTVILSPDLPEAQGVMQEEYLARQIKERFGITISSTIEDKPIYYQGKSAIRICFNTVDERPLLQIPPGETIPDSNGYILNIAPDRIAISSRSREGAYNAIATLMQLINNNGGIISAHCAHIYDYPDYPDRWVFSQHNLRGPGSLQALRKIEDTMAAYKLNGMQQNDWKYNVLDQQPRYYFDSVRAFRKYSEERGIDIIPGVAPIGYSDGILYNDPELAEGFPATATFVIEGDTGRLVRDPNITLPNGSFESLGANGKFSGWSFYDEPPVTQDAEHHGGSHSALCQNFTNGNTSGNCRFSRKLTCKPFHSYRMSAWVKTESLKADDVRLLAIGTDDANASRTLTYTAYSIRGTNGWTRVQVSFNSLQFPYAQVYAGVWGGESGKIWWDDFTVEESGLGNIIRRDGTPVTVRNRRTGALCAEGTDFAPISDSLTVTNYLQTQRFAPDAPAPTFRRRPGGAIANGDTVTISYFHPLTTVADEQGGGSVMVCPAEEKLYPVLNRQIRGVDSLYNTLLSFPLGRARFFMGHDEIRAMNWDSSCQRQHLPPSALLANNLKRCQSIIQGISPGAETFVWSDMFDSLHNAYNNYYLINGDLTGDWDSIPTTPVIVNWNGGNMDRSLGFFADHGFRQITSPYYDAGSPDGIRAWRLAMQGKEGMLGMMYTTWSNDYNVLVPFSYYAWGAGPYIIHVPYDSTIVERFGKPFCFSAIVLPDPYDKSDTIRTR
jgi:hypothetical protein